MRSQSSRQRSQELLSWRSWRPSRGRIGPRRERLASNYQPDQEYPLYPSSGAEIGSASWKRDLFSASLRCSSSASSWIWRLRIP